MHNIDQVIFIIRKISFSNKSKNPANHMSTEILGSTTIFS